MLDNVKLNLVGSNGGLMMKVNPQYVLIAKDIAQKINNGVYPVGFLLKGRTLLSSEYKVSSETIRKAINLLALEKVVVVKHGVGVFVDSLENAKVFLNKTAKLDNNKKQKEELKNLISQRDALNKEIEKSFDSLIKNANSSLSESFHFEEIEIPDDCWVINQTIGDVYFYNYTEATIVAIKRGDRVITSPGPDFTFIGKDVLIIIGKDKLSVKRALTYLYYGVES